MLQRISLLERRKKKKVDLEKAIQVTRSKLEVDLKQQNKKSEDDYLELEKIDAKNVKFSLSSDAWGMIPVAFQQLGEYVTVNNEYVSVKGLEEKAKVSKFYNNINNVYSPRDRNLELEIRRLTTCQI